MKDNPGEYARDVDYKKIDPFKRAMMEMARKTFNFPNRWKVYLDEHGNASYLGVGLPKFRILTEGLGHKNRIAEEMYSACPSGETYYNHIGEDTMLMAINDIIAFGARPVCYTDEVASPNSEWFEDEKRSMDLAEGFFTECKRDGIALTGGESPSLPLLVRPWRSFGWMRPKSRLLSAPVLSGCVLGIIPPYTRPINRHGLCAGDVIIGVTSSGLHSNGSTLVIRRSRDLPEQFLTKLPNGNTLGEEALIPTRSYVDLVDALLEEEIDIHALIPGTGGGISKVAADERPFTYRIHSWVDEIPPLFLFMRELGVTLRDCVATFNWGVGYYIIVPPSEVARTLSVGEKSGYELFEIGRVEEGERKVIFEPEDLVLAPPGG